MEGASRKHGEIVPPHLRTLPFVRDEPSAALAESELTVEEPGHVPPTERYNEN